MKTAIVYYSEHHGNTKKLLDAIAAEHEVTLIDVTKQPPADLSGAGQLLDYAREHLPEQKNVFYIYTHGAPKGDFLKAVRRIAEQKNCREIGSYRCQGFDTFGPFKLVGGLAKGHPTEAEISAAVSFYAGL